MEDRLIERFGKVKAGETLNKQIAEAEKPNQHGDADAHNDERQKVGSKIFPKRVLFVCHVTNLQGALRFGVYLAVAAKFQ